MSDLSGYKNIFKTTFLFGFVQVFNIFVKVGINKVVAILLGTAGMGVISLFQYAVSFLSVSCGLGINQSSIRDISEARERGENSQIDLTVSFIKSIIVSFPTVHINSSKSSGYIFIESSSDGIRISLTFSLIEMSEPVSI